MLDCAKPLEHFAGEAAKSVGRAGAGRKLENRPGRGRCLFECPARQNFGVEHVVAVLGPQPFADSDAAAREGSTIVKRIPSSRVRVPRRTRTFSTEASRLTNPST